MTAPETAPGGEPLPVVGSRALSHDPSSPFSLNHSQTSDRGAVKGPQPPAEWTPPVLGAMFCRGNLRGTTWGRAVPVLKSTLRTKLGGDASAFPHSTHRVYFFCSPGLSDSFEEREQDFGPHSILNFCETSNSLTVLFSLYCHSNSFFFLGNFRISRQWILVMSITIMPFIELLSYTRCFSWDSSFHSA